MSRFSIRLKELRDSRSFTQSDLAEAVDIPRSTIASWEAGKRTPELGTAQALADFFGVSSDYLLGRTDRKHKDTGSMPTSLEDFLDEQEVLFDGVPMTDEEKQSVLEALRAIWRMKHSKEPE